MNEYKLRENIHTADINDVLFNRNVRVYKNQYSIFADWCKYNGIIQADALYKVIDWIINDK